MVPGMASHCASGVRIMPTVSPLSYVSLEGSDLKGGDARFSTISTMPMRSGKAHLSSSMLLGLYHAVTSNAKSLDRVTCSLTGSHVRQMSRESYPT